MIKGYNFTIDEKLVKSIKNLPNYLPPGYEHLSREDFLNGTFTFPKYVKAIFFATDVMAYYKINYRANVVKGRGFGKTEITFVKRN